MTLLEVMKDDTVQIIRVAFNRLVLGPDFGPALFEMLALYQVDLAAVENVLVNLDDFAFGDGGRGPHERDWEPVTDYFKRWGAGEETIGFVRAAIDHGKNPSFYIDLINRVVTEGVDKYTYVVPVLPDK
jgi:hypothetical protein